MKRFLLALVVCAQFVAQAWASDKPELVDGEVRRINVQRGSITIAHGPIPQLDMGAMTMAFMAKNSAMLQAVKPGDKVKFLPEKVGDDFFVIRIEVAK
jgi:Cu(I)/Ag(I) efflux system periplasmic protein CusF